jgi:hypothetical protein
MLSQIVRVAVIEVGSFVRSEARANHRTPLEHADEVFRRGAVLHFVSRIGKPKGRRPLIIVGPRRAEELKYLKDVANPATIVALEASFETRYSRKLGGHDSTILWHRDSVEKSWGFEDAVRLADAVVDGEQPLPSVVNSVREAWRSLDHSRKAGFSL